MSVWTHVAGVIRTDSLRLITSTKLIQAMGKTCTYNDRPEIWEKATADKTPMGSEGSLQWRYSDCDAEENSISKGLIYLWGDLRDFDSASEIINWLKDKLEKLKQVGIYPRQMCMTIDVETDEYVWILEGNYDTFVVRKVLKKNGA